MAGGITMPSNPKTTSSSTSMGTKPVLPKKGGKQTAKGGMKK